MKNNKRVLIFILMLLVALSLGTTSAFAAESEIKVSIDGKMLGFEVPPTIVDGSTLVPVRAIFESLGATVQWDAATKTVTGIKGDTNIRLVINSKVAYVNKRLVTLEVPAMIIDGSTLVPARFIAESLGADVGWEGETKTVKISAGRVITFADPNLEAAIRSAIKKEKGDILSSDVKVLTTLSAMDKKISNLEGIQYLTNLQSLNLNNNQISNLKPLSGLTNLKALFMSNNLVKDISALESLKDLELLQMYSNNISNLSPLKNLTELSFLNLGNNILSDIGVLSNLTNMKQLYLYRTQINDLGPLKGLNNLTTLSIYQNATIDLSPLKGLENLKTLYIEDTEKSEEINDSLFTRYEAMTNKAKQIVSTVVKPGMSQLEKEMALHDYLVNHIKYDKVNADKNTIPKESHSPSGFFEKGVAVCDGYAEALKILLNLAGIESLIVRGDTLESTDNKIGHAWNIVKIDGVYYHLDPTWNDSSYTGSVDRLSHTFFNLSDKQILATHTYNIDYYPRCTKDSTLYNQYLESYREAVYTNEWLYTINSEGYLFKVSLKDGKSTKLSSDKIYSINYYNDWIIYQNNSDGNRLYKMKTDGTGKTKILDDVVSSVKVVNDTIYYIANSNTDRRIFKIKVDGSGKAYQTLDEIISYFHFHNGQLYYRGYSWTIGAKLFKMSTDSKEVTKVINDNIPGFERKSLDSPVSFTLANLECYDRDTIYYVNASDGDKLYKIGTDGSGRTKLSDDQCKNIELVNDWVYYLNTSDNKYYRVKTDGTQRQAIP